MTDLITFLSNDKGVIAHVDRVIKGMEWGKVYVLTDEIDLDYSNEKCEIFKLDKTKTISEIKKQITDSLKNKIADLEVGVNFIAGSGKEHMALLAALIQLGLGMRLIVLTKEGVKEI